MRPQAVILAGPNGAGKSTAKTRLIPEAFAFLNADEIARSEGVSELAAGRLLLARLREVETSGRSFAIETNLANRTLAQRIPLWQDAGYRVSLYYLWVPNPDFAVARVALRVRSGGHDIPEATIRRRYARGLCNFFEVYVPLVDRWKLFDSSAIEGPRLVGRGVRSIRDSERWRQIRKMVDREHEE